jgi:hypothetical protein
MELMIIRVPHVVFIAANKRGKIPSELHSAEPRQATATANRQQFQDPLATGITASSAEQSS